MLAATNCEAMGSASELTSAKRSASQRARSASTSSQDQGRPAAFTRSINPLMKLVVDRESQVVVGAHMVGLDAPEIIQTLAIAVKLKATKAQIDQTIAIHPTAAEEFVTMRTPVAAE